jgi:diguanylate cyclase (GGDEF)-like protein
MDHRDTTNVGGLERRRQLLGGVLDAALGLVDAHRGSVMLLDERQRLRMLAQRGLPADVDLSADYISGPAGEALRSGNPLHLEGPLGDGRGLAESLILPLKNKSGARGTINLSRDTGAPWAPQMRERVIHFADSLGQVIDVIHRDGERDQRMIELDRVLAFSRIFGSTRDLSKILELLLSCSRELTGCARSFVTLYTQSGDPFEAWAGHSLDSALLERVMKGLQASFDHEFFAYAKPQLHSALSELPRSHPLSVLHTEGAAEHAVVVPLVFGYRILGRLYLLNTADERLHRETLRLLLLLAHEASIAIDQARSMRELQELAFVDPLTRVFNRNYWMQRFEEELVRSERRAQPLSLLMIDIDHFKAYNDTYGHLVGDEVLRMVAQVVRSCLREVDVLGRFGGEEFGVLLPDTDEAGATYVAERVRLMVEQLDLGRPASRAGGLTISIGLACTYGRRTTVEEHIRQADTALFVSKEEGRNRISVYSEEGVTPGQVVPLGEQSEDDPMARLSSSSDFLFQMAENLGRSRQPREIRPQLGFQILIIGGAEGEHMPLSHLFDSMGYRTLVNPLAAGSDPLGGHLPDLAILDLDPVAGHYDNLGRLRRLKARDPMLPVIVLTGQLGIEKAVEAIRLGADDYLLKPFGAKEMRACVEKAFSKRFRMLKGSSARPSEVKAELIHINSEVRQELADNARELRVLQAFNQRSLEHPSRGILMLSSSRTVLQVNQLATDMLGIPRDKLKGQSLFMAASALDNPRIANALTHVKQTGEGLTINDLWLRAEGSDASALFKLQLQPLDLEDGSQAIFILMENLLNQQRLEEEARKLRMRLAQEIHGRIAQDLQVIHGRIDLLSLQLGDESARKLDDVQQAARRISHMLGELGADLPASNQGEA